MGNCPDTDIDINYICMRCMYGFTDEIKICFGISGTVARSTKVKFKNVLR